MSDEPRWTPLSVSHFLSELQASWRAAYVITSGRQLGHPADEVPELLIQRLSIASPLSLDLIPVVAGGAATGVSGIAMHVLTRALKDPAAFGEWFYAWGTGPVLGRNARQAAENESVRLRIEADVLSKRARSLPAIATAEVVGEREPRDMTEAAERVGLAEAVDERDATDATARAWLGADEPAIADDHSIGMGSSYLDLQALERTDDHVDEDDQAAGQG